jgi:hypothetical protein
MAARDPHVVRQPTVTTNRGRRPDRPRADRHGERVSRFVGRRKTTRALAPTRRSFSSGSIRTATGSFPKRNSSPA